MTTATAANYHVLSIIDACDRLGLDRARLLEESGIRQESLKQPYDRQSGNTLLRLWRSAETSSGDPLLALRIGMNGSSLHRSMLTTVIETSPTLERALFHAMRYQHLTQSLVTSALSWDCEQSLGKIEASSTVYSLEQVRPQIERQFAFFIAEAKNLSARSASSAFSRQVHFTFAPQAAVSEYERLLGCEVKFFQQRNQLVFDRSIIKLKNFCGSQDTQASLIELLDQHVDLLKYGRELEPVSA